MDSEIDQSSERSKCILTIKAFIKILVSIIKPYFDDINEDIWSEHPEIIENGNN